MLDDRPARLIVTLDGSRPLKDVSADLSAQGFQVEEELEAVNCLVGSTLDRNRITAMRSIRGIQDISDDRPVNIGPPGSPVTW
jgi:hypothetical protein